MTPIQRFRTWAILVIAITIAYPAWFWLLRGNALLQPRGFGTLVTGWLSISALLAAVAVLLRTTPSDAIRLSPRTGTLVILGLAALFHACALLPAPLLSSDFLRYRLDGKSWLSGHSPYALSPADADRARDALDSVYPHPKFHTIYPPVAQLTFVTCQALEMSLGLSPPGVLQRGLDPSAHPWRPAVSKVAPHQRGLVYRIAFAASALAATAILIMILHRAGQSTWWAVLFGWNPLVIVETGSMIHVDAAGIALLLASIWAMRGSRVVVAALLLALAAAVKPIAVLPAAFLVNRSNYRRFVPIFVAALVVLYGSVLIHTPSRQGWLSTGLQFTRDWEANASVYRLLTAPLREPGNEYALDWMKTMYRVAAIAVLAAAVVAMRLRRRTWGELASTNRVLMLVFLLGTTVYPWYILWALALVPLIRGSAGWSTLVFAATCVLSYRLWDEPTWQLPGWLVFAEYAPVVVVLLLEAIAAKRSQPIDAGQLMPGITPSRC